MKPDEEKKEEILEDPDDLVEKEESVEDKLLRIQQELEKERQARKTLEGKYNAEVPRDYVSITDNLRNEIASLRAENVALYEQLKTTKVEPPAELNEVLSEVPNLDKIVTYYADKIASEKIAKVEEKIKAQEVDYKAKTFQSFKSELSKEVPDWEELNRDPQFLSWLEKTDEMSGLKRIDLLRDAAMKADSARAKTFFNKFKEETNSSGKNIPINTLVNPGKSTEKVQRKESNTVITRDFIKKFYNDYTKGKYSNSPEDAKKIESLIKEAVSSGRVV